MDAVLPSIAKMPRAASVRLTAQPYVEPLSGLSLWQVSATWDVPDRPPLPPFQLELRLDGVSACRAEIGFVEADDIPPGNVRLGAGLQLPCEDAHTIEAAIVGPEGEVALPVNPSASAKTHHQGFLRRTLYSLASGEVFSLHRWKARLNRWVDAAILLRQRVRDRNLRRRFTSRSTHDAYVENTTITPRMRSAMEDELRRFRRLPTFSILMPVYNVDPRWLKKAIDSVRDQVYPHWELCLADDASTRPDLLRFLEGLNDSRIKLVHRESNGHICAATNSAADLATGEFVAFMDNDDALAPDALFAIADAIRHQPDADLIYSDEDKIDANDHRYDPQFKPDWSPELLLSYNFVNHFMAVRRPLFESVGRLRLGFEGAQDHDLLLRITERTDRIVHVSRILYHWRSLPSSTASAAGVKTYVHTASERAVAEALERRGSKATLYAPPVATRLNLPIRQLDGPDRGPRVAVLVHGPADAARRTLHALRTRTAYANFTDYLVLASETPAESLNQAAAAREEEYLLVLEAGAEPTDDRWLSRLMAYVTLDGVGLGAGRMLDDSGHIASAGTVLGMRDGLGPKEAFEYLPQHATSYYFLAESARNLAAARGACLLVRRALFDRIGGFDARRYPRSLWDVDFSLRLRGLGHRIAYVPGAEFRRCERVEKPDPPSELLSLKQAWGRQDDPFHNPNCSAREPFRPKSDSPLSLPAEASTPQVRMLTSSPTFNAAEGAPRCLLDIVLGLDRRGGIAPCVWSPIGGSGESELRDAGIALVAERGPTPQRFIDGRWSLRDYLAFQRFAKGMLRRERPEIVFANTLLSFPLVEAAASVGIPSVWVLSETYSEAQMAALYGGFVCRRIAMAFRTATRIIPVSHDNAERFGKLFDRGSECVIHNGLPKASLDEYIIRTSREGARHAVEVPAGRTMLLAVGTVCERKGQHTLVEAAARLAKSRSDFLLCIVGMRKGVPYAEYIRDLVRRREIEHFVRLVPETGNVRPYFRAADIYVNSSHLEAYSLAILEAEAFSLPVVSTPCPGLNEQVVWGENALRFARNDADGLAAVLGPLLDDERRRKAMARESRAMFDLHISDEEMLDRYESLILSSARRGPRSLKPYEPARDPAQLARVA